MAFDQVLCGFRRLLLDYTEQCCQWYKNAVSGADDKGHAIDGHIENCNENSIMKFFKKHTEKKVTKSKCSCPKQ